MAPTLAPRPKVPLVRLADFLESHRESILLEWEHFAREASSAGALMNTEQLRDHADAMLDVIAADLRAEQSDAQAFAKSQGRAPRANAADTAGELHATARLESGFTLDELIVEFRALRASVLKLWFRVDSALTAENRVDMIRFNEAIDQTLAESVARYTGTVKRSTDLFLAILGHDLRTPLGATLSSAELILRINPHSPDFEKLAGIIVSSGLRMRRMVDDLTEFARLQLGSGLGIVTTSIDLASTCLEAIDEVRVVNPRRHIEFSSNGDTCGLFDGPRVAQIVSNLVTNAIQHGAPDQPILISLVGDADTVTLTVGNRGAPIEAADLQRVFEPMKRGGTPTDPRTHSLGLGLFIAKEIAEAHGGRIEVVSSDGDRTAFTVTLPRHPSPSPT